MRSIVFVCLTVIAIVSAAHALAAVDQLRSVAEEIRKEAVLPNRNELGYPLPLAAHWNSGQAKNGFSPEYQLQMIEEGHYLLPWFSLAEPSSRGNSDFSYYEKGIQKAARLKLPISFISTQWERFLSEPPYVNLAKDKNPNVIDRSGKVLRKVSPFGPVAPWQELGRKWTANPALQKIQKIYPQPPLVLFVSNNEHSKLLWTDLDEDSLYRAKYGRGRDDHFKRKIVGDGWIERYRALQQGMREGLNAPGWKGKSVFTGYDAFCLGPFGRWGGWLDYALYTPGRFDPGPLAWDGASVSYYVNNWDATTDFTVMGPQIQAMNWVFMQKEARKLNPEFRFEMSIWDGYEPTLANDKRKFYARIGQQFNPTRYEGYVQYGIWLLRPRIVREFRKWDDTLAQAEPYFHAVMRAVDRVHTEPILRKFWRKGQLVANNAHQHPYQSNIPDEYRSVERWFLLDTDPGPKFPLRLTSEIPVFSLALALGESPGREWLVYAHSPTRKFNDVKISIPGYKSIAVNVTTGGCFYHVTEKANVVKRVAGSETVH